MVSIINSVSININNLFFLLFFIYSFFLSLNQKKENIFTYSVIHITCIISSESIQGNREAGVWVHPLQLTCNFGIFQTTFNLHHILTHKLLYSYFLRYLLFQLRLKIFFVHYAQHMIFLQQKQLRLQCSIMKVVQNEISRV